MKTRLITFLVVALFAVFVTSSVRAAGKPFNVSLTGAAEVPAAGDPDGSGTAKLTLNQGQGEVCFEITVEDIVLPAIGAHIHLGEVDEAGPVAVALIAPDENGSSSGCVDADKDLVKEIRKNASDYYVNVHNPEYPAGALRGQLE